MIRFQRVDATLIPLLDTFLNRLGSGSASFRYFQKRPLSVVNSHLITVLIIDGEGSPVAYGHLDREHDKTWLGVAVAEREQGKELGKAMVDYLIEYAKGRNEKEITLTVDMQNGSAIQLYEKVGFVRVSETDTFFRYALPLS